MYAFTDRYLPGVPVHVEDNWIRCEAAPCSSYEICASASGAAETETKVKSIAAKMKLQFTGESVGPSAWMADVKNTLKKL